MHAGHVARFDGELAHAAEADEAALLTELQAQRHANAVAQFESSVCSIITDESSQMGPNHAPNSPEVSEGLASTNARIDSKLSSSSGTLHSSSAANCRC